MAENLIIFKAISNCIKDLGESFGEKQRSLLLYKHLIEKTTIVHEEPIKKHISAWKKYCLENSQAIIDSNESELKGNVQYSEKVFLNFNDIFKVAEKDDKTLIWQHLLNIHAFMDPSSRAKEILKKQMENGGKEDEFLHNIINKVEQQVDPTANPMDAVGAIMNSGIFGDLVQGMNSGINDGSMNMGRLLGSVNKMGSSLGALAGNDLPPEMSQMTTMFNSMMNSLPQSTPSPTCNEMSTIKDEKPSPSNHDD